MTYYPLGQNSANLWNFLRGTSGVRAPWGEEPTIEEEEDDVRIDDDEEA